MATKSHKNKHYYSNSYPSKLISDVPYLWYPMLVKDQTFKDVLAERWNAVSGDLKTYASEITATAKRIAVSWEYNNSIWPAYHSTNKRSEVNGSSIAFRGDELMSSWQKVYENLYNIYMTRLENMDTFVGLDKNWPEWTISKK